jgi:anaphase-promoting complex subunit 2
MKILQEVTKNNSISKKFLLKIQSKIFNEVSVKKKFSSKLENFLMEEFFEDDEALVETFLKLKSTGLLMFTNEISLKMLINKIEEKINEVCEDLGEEETRKQKLNEIFEWFQLIESKISFLFFENSSEIANELKSKIYEIYANKRISQIFEIIVEYPESIPIIKDLKECLIKKNLTNELIQQIVKSFKKRLLIIGATTSDIITQYINMVRSLSILDPTEVALLKINPIMKEYLLKRNDAVSCIISDLIDEENDNELHKELINNDYIESNIDSEDENWEPEPLHSNPRKISFFYFLVVKSKKGIDIIKKIIEMFENKEIFANEYQNVLGNQLMSKMDSGIEEETKTLEFLKLRFGEKNLFNCEVMLKDITDSKRLNAFQHKKFKLPKEKENIKLGMKEVDSLIISRIYWPKITQDEEEASIKLHPIIESMLMEYQKNYHSYQAPRTLIFFKDLGNINLQIEIGSKEFDLNLTPINASLIMFFCDEETWEIHDLSKVTKISVENLSKRLNFWANKKFLTIHENEDAPEEIYYQLVEEVESEQENEDDENEEDEMEEDVNIEVYETLIETMLTNFDTMDAEKIHNSLKMFAMDPFPAYEHTLTELNTFLNQLTMDGKLIRESDNSFSLKK